jgi:hypothetical protein
MLKGRLCWAVSVASLEDSVAINISTLLVYDVIVERSRPYL